MRILPRHHRRTGTSSSGVAQGTAMVPVSSQALVPVLDTELVSLSHQYHTLSSEISDFNTRFAAMDAVFKQKHKQLLLAIAEVTRKINELTNSAPEHEHSASDNDSPDTDTDTDTVGSPGDSDVLTIRTLYFAISSSCHPDKTRHHTADLRQQLLEVFRQAAKAKRSKDVEWMTFLYEKARSLLAGVPSKIADRTQLAAHKERLRKETARMKQELDQLRASREYSLLCSYESDPDNLVPMVRQGLEHQLHSLKAQYHTLLARKYDAPSPYGNFTFFASM